MAGKAPEIKTVCVNRRARFEYEIVDTVEAGLSLRGSEVKGLREGRGNLVDAYVLVREGRASLLGCEISAYSHDATRTLDPRRTRTLLLHAREIRKLQARTREKGLTLVALSIYFRGPWAKLEVALARGRKTHDKRHQIRAREARRDVDRALRRRR